MVKIKLGVVTREAGLLTDPGPALALDDSFVLRYTRLTTQDAFLATVTMLSRLQYAGAR